MGDSIRAKLPRDKLVAPPIEVAAAINAKVVMHAGHIGLSYSVQLCDERANGFGTLSSNFFLVMSEMGGASIGLIPKRWT